MADVEKVTDMIPQGSMEVARMRNLLSFNKKIGLLGLKAFQSGQNYGVNQVSEIINFFNRLNGRIDILWNITYKEQLGEVAQAQYYKLIADSTYEFPEECFICKDRCTINEKKLFEHIDQVIAQSVETFKQLQSSESSRLVSSELAGKELSGPGNIMDRPMTEIADQLIKALDSVAARDQSQVAQAVQMAQAAAGAQSSKIITQLIIPTAPSSSLSVPMWAKAEFAVLCKDKDRPLVLKSIYNKLAIQVEQAVEQDVALHPGQKSAIEIVGCKKSLVNQLYAYFASIITKHWNQTYHAMMNDSVHGLENYYDIVQHCLDDYQEELLHFWLVQEGSENKIRCIFPSKTVHFIDNKIRKDISLYLEDQKKLQEDQQKHLLAEQARRVESLRLEELQKQKQIVANQFNTLFRQPAEQLFSAFGKDKQQLLSDSYAQTNDQVFQAYVAQMDSEYQKSSKLVKERIQEKIRNKQELVAANAASAQKFYEAEQETEKRKCAARKRFLMTLFTSKVKELFSSFDSGRAAIETEELLGAAKIGADMQNDWRLAAQVTMKRMQDDRAMLQAQLTQEAKAIVQAAKEIEAAYVSLVDSKAAQLQAEESRSSKAVKREAAEAKAAPAQAEERVKAVEAKAAQEAKLQAERSVAEVMPPFLEPVRPLSLMPVGYDEADVTSIQSASATVSHPISASYSGSSPVSRHYSGSALVNQSRNVQPSSLFTALMYDPKTNFTKPNSVISAAKK